MTSSLRRLLFVVSLVVLVASGCASSSDEADSATADASTNDGPTPATPDDSPTTDDAEPTSIPLPDDDDAADAAIAGLDSATDEVEEVEEANADRSTTAQSFVRSRFNIDPEPGSISCIVAESQQDDVLDVALQTPAVGRGEVDDTQLRALTYAMNGCVQTLGLADWATQAIGPQGEVQETAPPCFVERFDDADSGDLTFYTFVALTYQFRLDPVGSSSLVEALTECTPITSLGDFFASQAEQTSNFETIVDRTCLQDALSPTDVSAGFWAIFVEGGQPPADFITPYTDGCSEVPTSDLAEAPPADFEPWAGTRALSDVQPSARAGIYSEAPPMTLTTGASYEAILSTAGSDIRIKLFPETAPITVNNFVSLARDGYFDGTIFHRVLADFMAQGGDPTGTGTGGPGYQFEDEVDNGPALDRKGLLAMANAGPGTNGSQFFITFVPTEWLTGNHTVFGEVIEGIEIVDAIELREPSAPTGRGQVIESVTIIES